MGNNLSPILAIIYMDFIEQNILVSRNTDYITSWLRYNDDIFLISPLSDILYAANSVSTHIKFTSEASIDNQLSFLDTVITYDSDTLSFTTKLFIKSTHSNNILHFASSVPLQRKIALLTSERKRVIRNSTSLDDAREGLSILRSRFLANG